MDIIGLSISPLAPYVLTLNIFLVLVVLKQVFDMFWNWADFEHLFPNKSQIGFETE